MTTTTHLTDEQAAIEAAKKFRAYRFQQGFSAGAAFGNVARDMGVTLAQVGPMIGRGLGLQTASRD